ncbi:hypothetical protein LU674_017605 [Pseudomonas alloputida]|uniref:Uncharacterized protein n=1 Tax=Pseudomonas alloputida TaxID=1940621 RepID=A0AAW7HIN0_9PSED|nr:hypothetical protein [Pseudomonas alloputida]MDM3954126.1 hypothetical protein [Pseudomonas alloputida]
MFLVTKLRMRMEIVPPSSRLIHDVAEIEIIWHGHISILLTHVHPAVSLVVRGAAF